MATSSPWMDERDGFDMQTNNATGVNGSLSFRREHVFCEIRKRWMTLTGSCLIRIAAVGGSDVGYVYDLGEIIGDSSDFMADGWLEDSGSTPRLGWVVSGECFMWRCCIMA